MNGSQIIFNHLKNKGIKHVFGYSGGAVLPLLDKFHNQNHISFIKSSNEQCAGYSAEGYAKSLNNKLPGVVISTSGPGVTNLITPLQDAYSDGIPLIVITAQVSSNTIGTDAFQECNATGLTTHCTKVNKIITSIDTLECDLEKIFRIAMAPRMGPVHLDIPKDILLKEAPIDILTNKLLKSKKPLLIVGQGCNQYSELLRTVINHHKIPVTSTIHAMGIYPEDDLYGLEMLGMHGNAATNYLVQEADLIIGIGMRYDDRITGKLSKFATNAINNQGIIHVDSSISQINKVKQLFNKTFSNTSFLESYELDSKDFLEKLLQIPSKNRTEWTNIIKDKRTSYPFKYNKSNKLKVQDIVSTIDKLIDKENTIFTTGVGNHQMFTAQFIKWTHPNRLLTSGSLGTMGVGLPFAIGAQLANPKKNVILIDGDGSFGMTLTDLQTVMELKLPIKIFVMNDKRQQMVHVWQKLFFNERYVGTDNTNPDYMKLGSSFNIKTIQLYSHNDLSKNIKNIIEYPGPVLIDCVVEPDICLPLVKPGCALDDMLLEKDNTQMEGDVPN